MINFGSFDIRYSKRTYSKSLLKNFNRISLLAGMPLVLIVLIVQLPVLPDFKGFILFFKILDIPVYLILLFFFIGASLTAFSILMLGGKRKNGTMKFQQDKIILQQENNETFIKIQDITSIHISRNAEELWEWKLDWMNGYEGLVFKDLVAPYVAEKQLRVILGDVHEEILIKDNSYPISDYPDFDYY